MTQKEALNILKLGTSVFITGPAGSGKTYLLNKYIEFCKEHNMNIAITASTGIAATYLNGSTLHSWSGTGIKEKLNQIDLDLIMQKKNIYERFLKTQVLIIDEISMLNSYKFEMVDKLAREIRKINKPFGGMQIILSGDFFQLPPISKNQKETDYIFKSKTWQELKPVICYLEKNYRQNEEDTLYKILTHIRENKIKEAIQILNNYLQNTKNKIKNSSVLKLYTHNEDIDKINLLEYSKIKNKEYIYKAKIKGKKNLIESIFKNSLLEENLKLKIGAKIIFIKNDPNKRYNNGTLGEIIDFDFNNSPIVKTIKGEKIIVNEDSWRIEEDGKILAEIKQLPLRLAWAITIHKSQGMSLDEAEIDLSKSFGYGMGYVALSRLKNINGLNLKGFNNSSFEINPEIIKFDKELRHRSSLALLALQKYSDTELDEKINNFILKAGGIIEKNKTKITQNNFKIDTLEITKRLLKQKLSLKEIAQERGLSLGTILTHLEKIKKENSDLDFKYLLPPSYLNQNKINKIKKILKKHNNLLSPSMEEIKSNNIEISFEDLRLIRLM